MKYLAIILSLVVFNPTLHAQSISDYQKRQLQRIGLDNQIKMQKQLSQSDRIKLQKIQAEAEAISGITSLRNRSKAMEAFNKKYSGFRLSLLKKTRFDKEAYLQEIKTALPGIQLKRGKHGFYAMTKKRKLQTKPGVKQIRRIKVKPTSKLKSSNQKVASFSSIDPSVKFETSNCNTYSNGGFLPERNGFSSKASGMVVGGCEARRGTGNNIQVPGGVRSVRVKIYLGSGFKLYTSAMGFLGYGHSQTEIGIRVKGAGMEEYFKDSEILCIGPVLYFDTVEHVENNSYVLEASFTPEPGGGNYRIQAYGKTFSMGIAGGVGTGHTSVYEVSKVEAIFEY